jgi:hypothetical protein
MTALSLSSVPAVTRRLPFLPALAGSLALALITIISVLTQFPFGTTPASAASDLFSAERALAHLPQIASQPHPGGTPAQAAVHAYLIDQLNSMGWDAQAQKLGRFANVVARLPGSDSTGAILVLTHYDSLAAVPGAADNGAGTAALLEMARALRSMPQMRNDLILLFDDAEEMPFIFLGTKGFIREHPWVDEIKVAIGLDTAVRGPVHVNETSAPNGRMVSVLAGAHQGMWPWSSVSGGGNYDVSNFRGMGIQLLELEDNYAFHEQHTPLDRPEIVKRASLQQMGDQVLGITRRLATLDLRESWGVQETFIFVPVLGLVHYPQAWSLPLAVAAVIALLAALATGLVKRIIRWRSLLLLPLIFASAGLTAAIISLITPRLPRILKWDTDAWPEWPEMVPPGSGYVFAAFLALGLGLALAAYLWARRSAQPMEISLMGLLPFVLIHLFLAAGQPRGAIIITWPALLGSLAWLLALVPAARGQHGPSWPAFLAAALFLVHLPALLLGDFMSEGLNSIGLLSLVWGLLLFVLLPGIEVAITGFRPRQKPALPEAFAARPT